MPQRPFLRPLLVIGLTVAGLVAVVGGLALRGPGLIAVGVAGALAACLGWGTARESTAADRRATGEAAVLAAAWTVGVLLVLTGTSVLAGGVTAAVVAGAGALVALGFWIARTPKDPAAPPHVQHDVAAPVTPLRPAELRRPPAPPRPADPRPVQALSTEELGHEWLESTAALGGRLEPATRNALVRRRQEALDELERRDPAGFLRWLAAGPVLERDPAEFVRGRTAGESAAGTDAA